MKELKEFTINLEHGRNSFCIGEPMRGHIILNFDEPAEMRNIKVRFYGEAYSQLNGIQGGKNGSKKQKKENIVDLTKLLFGLHEGTAAESVPLHPNGTYRYDFNFQLPRYLPCSFESPKEREWGLAFIRYFIEATITRPWRTNVSKQIPVNVNEIIDTSLPEYSYRPGCQTQKELGSCLSDGMLSIEAYLDDICYNQGGDILISCSAENDSNRIMTSVYAKLCRRTRYRRKNETKTYVDVVSEYFGDRVLPKRSVSWTNLKFKVPEVGPTITKSKRVNVDYYLRVGMYQLFREEIHVDLPIVIGMTKAFLEEKRMNEEQLGNDVSINVDPVPSRGIDMQEVNRQQLEDIADIFMQMPYEGKRPSVQYISALARKNRRKNSVASTPRQSVHDDSDGSLIGFDRRQISKSADFLDDGYNDDPGYLSPGGLGSRRASETSLYASSRPKAQAGSQRKVSSSYPSRQNSTTPRQQKTGSSAWERINKPRQTEASMRKAASQSAIETSRRPDSSASSQERSPRKSPLKRPTVRKTASQGMIDMKTAAQITAGLGNVRRKGGLKIKGQEKQGSGEEKQRLGQEKQELEQEKQNLQEDELVISQEQQLESGVLGNESSKPALRSPKLSPKQDGSASLKTESPGRKVQNVPSANKALNKTSKGDKKTAASGARGSSKSPAMSPIASAAESADASPAKVVGGSGPKSSANDVQGILDSQKKPKTATSQAAKSAAIGRKLTAKEAAAKATQQRLIKAKNVMSAANAFAKPSKKAEEMNSSRPGSASSSGSAKRMQSARGTGTKEGVSKQSKASGAKTQSTVGRKTSTSGVRGKEAERAAKKGSVASKESKVASKEDSLAAKAVNPSKDLQDATEPKPAVTSNDIDPFEELERGSDEQKGHLDDDIRNNNVTPKRDENIAAIEQQIVQETPQDLMNASQENRAQERKGGTQRPAIVEEDITAQDQRVVEQTPDYLSDLGPQAGDQESKASETKVLAMEDEIIPAIGNPGVEETPLMDFDFDAFDLSAKGKDVEQASSHSKNVDPNKAPVNEALQNVAEDLSMQSELLIDFGDIQPDSADSGVSRKAEKQQQKPVVVEDDINVATQERGLEETPALDFGINEPASLLPGTQQSNLGTGTTKSGVKPTTDAVANKDRNSGDQDLKSMDMHSFDSPLFEGEDFTAQQQSQIGQDGDSHAAKEGELKRAPSLDEFEKFEAEILGEGNGASSVVSPKKDASKSEQKAAGAGLTLSRKNSIARKTSVTRKTSVSRKTSVTRKDSSGRSGMERENLIGTGKDEKATKGEFNNINDADRKMSVGRRQSLRDKRRSLGENGEQMLEDMEDRDQSLEDIATGYYTPPEDAGNDVKGINILMDLSNLEGASASTVNDATTSDRISLTEVANVQDVKGEQDLTNDRSSSGGIEKVQRVSGDLAAVKNQMSTGSVEKEQLISDEQAARRDQVSSDSIDNGRRVSSELATTSYRTSSDGVEKGRLATDDQASLSNLISSDNAKKEPLANGGIAMVTASATSSKDENQNEFKAKASNAKMSWRRTFSKIKAVPSVEGFRRRSIVNIKVVEERK